MKYIIGTQKVEINLLIYAQRAVWKPLKCRKLRIKREEQLKNRNSKLVRCYAYYETVY